ncbi:MAG: hypothetical protein HZA54_17485 [Planctomycetes bacterium]|nr:hypothetical protein [Planctomycetota bacterium]
MAADDIRRLEEQLEAQRGALPRAFNESPQRALDCYDKLHRLERELAKARGEPYAQALDIGCQPSPSGSGEIFLQAVDGPRVFLFFANATHLDASGHFRDLGRAVVRLHGCSQTKFGYPNDEAFDGHPLAGRGFAGVGVFEVIGSPWEAELNRQNRVNFPETPPSHGLHHYLFAFKENVLECLCERIEVSITKEFLPTILEEWTDELMRD